MTPFGQGWSDASGVTVGADAGLRHMLAASTKILDDSCVHDTDVR